MPDLQYGFNVEDRDVGNLPKLPVVNLYVEKSDVEPSPVLQSRPGLDSLNIIGTGPIKQMYQIDGVLNGNLLSVSGSAAYSATTSIGTINGTGPVSIAGFEQKAFFCAGQDVFEYSGGVFSTVAMPGGFPVTSICVGTDRLIVIDDNTGKFYWSDVLSDVVGALSFATAEQSPDKLKELLFIGDTLMLFGSDTVEFWPASATNPDLPYSPLIGRTFRVGIRETGCAVAFANAFAWVTNHNKVCVGDPTNVVSTPSLEEKLSKSTTARLWTFFIEGVEFLAVRLDDSTWVFSSHSSQWSTFETYGLSNWEVQCYGGGRFGSAVDGQIFQWGTDYDDHGQILERRFRAGAPLTSESVRLDSLVLRTNSGQTPYLSGDYSDPVVELRMSRDGGYRWSEWRQKSLGQNGDYRKNITWRSLGIFSYPALLVEIRVTDPVPFRMSGLKMNEGYGGR